MTPDDTAPATPAPIPRRPRPESVFLALGLLWTVLAKLVILRRHEPEHLLRDFVDVSRGDLVFFAIAAGLFAALYAAGLRRGAARVTMLLGAGVLVWSLLNSAWMLATGVQLQPGVLHVLAQDPSEFLPVVASNLRQKAQYAIPLGLTVLVVVAWFGWRLLRPLPVAPDPRRHLLRATTPLAMLVLALGSALFAGRAAMRGHAAEALGFSSHWHAMCNATGSMTDPADVAGPTRILARAGQRELAAPDPAEAVRPNIVIILLESVCWEATSLRDPALATTPTMRRLAEEGAEFVQARVPVALTHKGFWATFTGSEPDIQADYAEAVLVDQPYESLASILAPAGYRSGFFQMARGSFQCAPGLFANLGFDHTWFRENLGDPTAHLNWINADDFRMLDPAFEWADAQPGPFLLSMITTAGHDPFEVPASFGPAPEGRYERYLHSIRYSDALVEEVCDRLDARGVLDDTIVCVIGDHGESFREGFRSSRWAPFEDVIRVPWVMRWPRGIEPGRRVAWPCSQMDVTPTILGLLGYDLSRAAFDGADALGTERPDRPVFFATWFPDSPRGVLKNGRKYVYWPVKENVLAYDLRDDPAEEHPVTIEGPEKDRLIEEIETWRRASRFEIPATRFRERELYEHWRTFSSGRRSWAYFVP